jgi:hypothetical protein
MNAVGVLSLVLLGGAAAAQPASYSSCAEVQQAIAALPASGGIVELGPGTIDCDTTLVVNASNVTLRGAGPATLFRLAAHVNRPVIVIGSAEAVPSTVVRGVTIRDLSIDGNAANQDRECSEEGCPSGSLRANGITIRNAEDVWIDNVAVRAARSGGLVTELGCRRVRVAGFTSSGNHFDGIALYQTEDSSFSNLRLLANGAAGISTDIQCRKNTFNDVVIRDAGSVGVFMRDSIGNLFTNVHVENSREHGLFLAQVDADAGKPASLNVFTNLRVESSGKSGVRINDASCLDNVINSAVLLNNAEGCVSEAKDGITRVGPVVCH